MSEIILTPPLDYNTTNLRGSVPFVYEEVEFTTDQQLIETSCNIIADNWLNMLMTIHATKINEVTFIPEDSLEHCNKQGKHCYMYCDRIPQGYLYSMNTQFIK